MLGYRKNEACEVHVHPHTFRITGLAQTAVGYVHAEYSIFLCSPRFGPSRRAYTEWRIPWASQTATSVSQLPFLLICCKRRPFGFGQCVLSDSYGLVLGDGSGPMDYPLYTTEDSASTSSADRRMILSGPFQYEWEQDPAFC